MEPSLSSAAGSILGLAKAVLDAISIGLGSAVALASVYLLAGLGRGLVPIAAANAA